MRGAVATALLGVSLLLTAAIFDAEPLYVPGVALVALAGITSAWVWLGARGLRVERVVGARSVLEDEVVAIEVHVRAGLIAPPSGAVDDELLPELAPIRA